jgi:gliding-associated putative ABC transporter substrate-binding component GldG
MASSLTAVQRKQRDVRLFSWTGATLLVCILLVINFIFSYFAIRLDTSDGRAYSISKGTKQILKDLDDTLLIKVMYSSQLPPQFVLNQQYVRDLLFEYRRASHGKIRLEFMDPGKSPKAKQDAMEAGVMPVQLDVRERDRREVKECFMGMALFYGDKKESIALIQDTQGMEYEISQRIKKLIKPQQTTIGIVTNGYALTLSSEPLQQLEAPIKQLYSIVNVDLTKDIPEGISALWLIGPNKILEPESVAKLKSWVSNGGTLGLLVDAREAQIQQFITRDYRSGIEDLLKEWGVEIKNGLVVDPRSDRIQVRSTQGYFQMINIIDYFYFPMVSDLDRENPATKGIDAVAMPFVSPLVITNQVPGLIYRPLGRTSELSWFDDSPYMVNPLQKKEPPPQALKGPFNVGLVIDGKFDSTNAAAKPGRVIVFGCSRFIRTDYPPRDSNYRLFFNLLDWSAQDEVLLSIRSKGVSIRPIKEMSEATRLVIKLLMVAGLPLLTLAAGLFIWRRQKNRRALLPLKYLES